MTADTAIQHALDAMERDFEPASRTTVDIASDEQKQPDNPETEKQPRSDPKASPAAPRAPPGRILLTREQVLVRCGISDATLRRRMASGLLPRPVELGNRYCLRWYSDELEAALAGLIRQSQPAANPQS